MKILLLLSLLFCACNRSSPPPLAAPAPVEEDCTLQTPLKPGIPGSPGHLIPSDLNMNGASELATLMRAMKADLERANVAMVKGEPIAPMHGKHRKLRCAWPTGLEDRNPVFEQSAISYLSFVRGFDEAKPEGKRAAYELVVSGCLACHASACPGPIPVIEKLRMLPQ